MQLTVLMQVAGWRRGLWGAVRTHRQGLARVWKPPMTCRFPTEQQYLSTDRQTDRGGVI